MVKDDFGVLESAFRPLGQALGRERISTLSCAPVLGLIQLQMDLPVRGMSVPLSTLPLMYLSIGHRAYHEVLRSDDRAQIRIVVVDQFGWCCLGADRIARSKAEAELVALRSR